MYADPACHFRTKLYIHKDRIFRVEIDEFTPDPLSQTITFSRGSAIAGAGDATFQQALVARMCGKFLCLGVSPVGSLLGGGVPYEFES